MTLEEQIKRIIENAERAGQLVEGVSTVEENLADFVRWCDAQGIVSQPDNSERAEEASAK